jgi:hypothetical protein
MKKEFSLVEFLFQFCLGFDGKECKAKENGEETISIYSVMHLNKTFLHGDYKFIHLNKVLQKFSTAQPSSSVAKHKLLRDTKKQQDVITSDRVIMTS